MNTYASRLKLARKHAGLTQSQLTELCGNVFTQQNLSLLEKTDGKGSKFTLQIANACGVNPDWLATGFGDMLEQTPVFSRQVSQKLGDYNVKVGNTIKGKCPVISWVRAGDMCAPEHVFSFNDAEEWRECPVPHSSSTFVLVVIGDSMHPEYIEGWDIFVDPTIQPNHNDDVIARDETGKATFKRLQITPEGRYLLALNPEHPERKIKVPEGTTICGVVIYSGKKRR
ncbi:hypothetical protein C3Y98_04565 [Methylotenera oryzisoli]|uniref:HTH cro/C1-type domain-containing protein n=1 Tax=Methylotenera oryzisoli TaxID=2080758 RepID=A0A4Y9VT16_9PROT|nr:XRE family transcriptional regulator [Methylotenera oryzisoli]TFW72079.1 hypothetical protein C3Y98_04565 [Methylotenera oryzisoli]